MDTLRFILIFFGAIIVAGIYLWDRHKSRANRQHNIPPVNTDDEPGLVITTGTEFDDDVSSDLANLKNYMIDSKQTVVDKDMGSIYLNKESLKQNNDETRDNSESDMASVVSKESLDEESKEVEYIIVLHIIARDGNFITGNALLTATEKVGFKFGSMDIFHFFYKDKSNFSQNSFGLVNMYEPGNFDIENIEDLTTQGISIFTSIKNRQSEEYIFEIMLDVAKKLSGTLDCIVCGYDRRPITEKSIKHIFRSMKIMAE